MNERLTSGQVQDNLVRALAHLRARYGDSRISLACLLQHAEVALFLEQQRVEPAALLQALHQLQRIGRIHDEVSHQSRHPSPQERAHIDHSLDSIFSALETRPPLS